MAKPKTKKKVEPTTPQVRGDVVMRPLSSVKKNVWNPNTFTPFMMDSLKEGFKRDGWLKSQSLLVWGTDEKGKRQDIIIDGEHRWQAGLELGMKQGPMVFLDKLTLTEAKKLTVKLDNKRGTFDDVLLGNLMREIRDDLSMVDNPALEMGFPEERYIALLNDPAEDIPITNGSNGSTGGVIGDLPSGQASHVKMQQLFFDPKQLEEYTKLTKDLAVKWKLQNASDIVLEALRVAHARPAKK